jgi:hypothetical protein
LYFSFDVHLKTGVNEIIATNPYIDRKLFVDVSKLAPRNYSIILISVGQPITGLLLPSTNLNFSLNSSYSKEKICMKLFQHLIFAFECFM